MEIYIYYIYLFFCKSHKVRQTQLVRKEKTHAKGFRFLFILPRGSGLFLLLLGLGWGKKKKKDAFKKDKVKRRALFFSLSLFPPLPLPPCLLLSFRYLLAESSLQDSLGSW